MRSVIRAYVTTYSTRIKLIKNEYFPGSNNEETDPFDEKSEFLVFECNDKIMAIGRLTMNPDGPLFSETHGKGAFRNESDTVDMGKYLIVEEYQGIPGLYELFCLTTFDYAIKKGVAYGNASMIVGKRLLKRLERLHFTICGDPVTLFQFNGTQCEILPLICNFKEAASEIQSDLSQLITKFSTDYIFEKYY